MVTGASGGIGFETVKGLLSSLPFVELVILAVRDVARTRDAVVSLPANTGSDNGVAVEIVAVDLSDSDSVVACVEAVYDLIGNRALDLLVCNAGVMAPPLQYSKATITVSPPPPPPSADDNDDAEDGSGNSRWQQQQQQQATSATSITTAIEQQYFVNFISHALLTDRLLPLLRHSSNARVVFVSSLAVAMAQTRQSPPCVAEKTGNTVTAANYSRWGCYADSKLAMSLFAKALSQREPRSIEFVSLHPGIVQTDLARHILPKWLQFPIPDAVAAVFGLLSPEQGARLSLDLAKAMPDTLESGAMYTALGRKQAGRNLIPLLDSQQAVDQLYNDTKAFIDSI